VAVIVCHKSHRLLGALFVATCLLSLRTQVELMQTVGFSMGFLPWLQSPSEVRGLVVYSIAILVFLVLARLSPQTKKIVFFAVSITVYILAFCASMVAMAL
jgi:hypothetical protein